MKDSKPPDSEAPPILQRARPPRTDSAPSVASESPEQVSPTAPAHDLSRTRRSRPETVVLAAFAIAGAIALVRLAHHVTSPQSEGNGGIIVHTEVISLWMHPAFLDIANRPTDNAACRSLEGYRRYADERGLQKAWYVTTVKATQINGQTMILSTIRRPYEMIEPFYTEFTDTLATAAGTPPRHPMTDFTKLKVRVIPSRFLDADPRAVLDELRMMECRPGEETEP
jgi:hypothetical protein